MHDDGAQPEEPASEPRRSRLLWATTAVLALLGVWALVVVVTLLSAASEARSAVDEVRALDGLRTSQLIGDEATGTLASARDRFETVGDRVDSWWMRPARLLPVAGRQLRSLDALSESAVTATAIGVEALEEARVVVGEGNSGPQARVEALERLADLAAQTSADLASLDLGPSENLVGALADARRTFAEELEDIKSAADTASRAGREFAALLRGPADVLVIAANNAEMRAGSGMFLSAGLLSTDDGAVEFESMDSVWNFQPPVGAVAIEDPDLEENWGRFRPTDNWLNLALTPRFEVSASHASRMWSAVFGETPDAVLLVDPVALKLFLETTGPVQVGGRTIDGANVVDFLLNGQYQGVTSVGARREAASEVAVAVLDAVLGVDSDSDLARFVDALNNAVAGRHLLFYGSESELQAASVDVGAAGMLTDRSMLLALSNRGGNKLDYFTRIRADLTTRTEDSGTLVEVAVTVRNLTPDGQPQYVAGPHPDVRPPPDAGEYLGVLSLNLPDAATDWEVLGHDDPMVDGSDGPTHVLGVEVSAKAGENRTERFRFRLPPEVSSFTIEPSGRRPPIRWILNGVEADDSTATEVSW